MKTAFAIAILFAALSSAFADGSVSAAITPGTISNLVAKLDTTATNANVEAYASMLAEDFTLTVTSDTPRGPLPQHQSKSDYVREMRASVKSAQILKAKTTIDQITISDSGTLATIDCTLAERTLILASKRICVLTMRQKFSLELREGELRITKLESQIAELKWE